PGARRVLNGQVAMAGGLGGREQYTMRHVLTPGARDELLEQLSGRVEVAQAAECAGHARHRRRETSADCRRLVQYRKGFVVSSRLVERPPVHPPCHERLGIA